MVNGRTSIRNQKCHQKEKKISGVDNLAVPKKQVPLLHEAPHTTTPKSFHSYNVILFHPLCIFHGTPTVVAIYGQQFVSAITIVQFCYWFSLIFFLEWHFYSYSFNVIRFVKDPICTFFKVSWMLLIKNSSIDFSNWCVFKVRVGGNSAKLD